MSTLNIFFFQPAEFLVLFEFPLRFLSFINMFNNLFYGQTIFCTPRTHAGGKKSLIGMLKVKETFFLIGIISEDEKSGLKLLKDSNNPVSLKTLFSDNCEELKRLNGFNPSIFFSLLMLIASTCLECANRSFEVSLLASHCT
jgi:hypothetical protein